ncbi:transposase [Rhodoferax ferrireducens]|uniref:transposase n=1 Tax=Rhodoferax ferrireducens TaxID=192843 RepID=UPI000E0DC1DD
MTDSKPIKRRRHSSEFKAQLIAQCTHPGISVAQVALNNGINVSDQLTAYFRSGVESVMLVSA